MTRGGSAFTALHRRIGNHGPDDRLWSLRQGDSSIGGGAVRIRPCPPDHRRVIDPRVTEPVFLTGVQFQPDNPSIVHHALTFAVPPEQVSAVRDRDAETPGEGYTCFGAIGAGSVVETWTPGGGEALFDGDMLRMTCTYDAGLAGSRPHSETCHRAT